MFHSAVRRVAKSTVGIVATWTDDQNPPSMLRARLVGSGFFLADNLAITAKHVTDPVIQDGGVYKFDGSEWMGVLACDEFKETGLLVNARFLWGRVLCASPSQDAAVLLVPSSNARPLPTAEKPPKIGDTAGALGYPLAENMPRSIRGRLRFTGGFISHVGTSHFPGEQEEFTAFEMDTMFIPGISGGPVFRPDGRVFALTHGTVTLDGGLIGLSVAVGIAGLLPLLQDSLALIKAQANQKIPPESTETPG
jgi:S1-C subfamily serine protease